MMLVQKTHHHLTVVPVKGQRQDSIFEFSYEDQYNSVVKKVLIVDDSRSARFFLKSCIPEGDYEVIEATNGDEGVSTFAAEQPDVVFMDLTMPVKDGFQAIPEILAADPNARVVVLTADIQKQTIQRIEELGAIRFLKKPPKKDTVAAVLSDLFQ